MESMVHYVSHLIMMNWNKPLFARLFFFLLNYWKCGSFFFILTDVTLNLPCIIASQFKHFFQIISHYTMQHLKEVESN